MTLTRRTALLVVAVTLVAALVVGTVAYGFAARSLASTRERQAYDAAAILLRDGDLVEPPAGERTPGLPAGARLADDARGLRIVIRAQGISPDGAPVAVAGQAELDVTPTVGERAVAAAGAGTTAPRDVVLDGERYVLVTVGQSGGGAVQVACSLGSLEIELGVLRAHLAIALAVVLTVALAVSLPVGRWLTRRLTGLVQVVEDVGDDDTGFDPRLLDTRRDEVGTLSRAFHHMLARLADARTQRVRLVQDVGHELRTPLTSVRTNVELLRHLDALAPHQRQELIDDLDSETRELTRLVAQVVEIAAHAPTDETPVDVDLHQLASEVTRTARRRYDRELLLRGTACIRTARPDAVSRALSTLVDNAVKFSPAGTPVDVVVGDGWLAVADRGPGIPEELRQRVFERFARAPGAMSAPGSGLGLSIVRDVAVAHGGRTFIVDRDGPGVLVGFTLTPDAPAPGHGVAGPASPAEW